MTKKQLHHVQKKMTSTSLSKRGCSPKTPRAVVFGPHLYGGLAMRPLWVEQIIQQSQIVIKHLRCPGDCNKMFRIALTWAQLNTGMGFHLLEYPSISVPHLECKWFNSMREGLAAIKGSIECFESFTVPIARDGDSYLMDAICDCKLFRPNQIQQINACRLYLQVLLLSDIATPKVD